MAPATEEAKEHEDQLIFVWPNASTYDSIFSHNARKGDKTYKTMFLEPSDPDVGSRA